MTPRYRHQDENGYWSCEDCGSLVAVRSFHDAWHDRLADRGDRKPKAS